MIIRPAARRFGTNKMGKDIILRKVLPILAMALIVTCSLLAGPLFSKNRQTDNDLLAAEDSAPPSETPEADDDGTASPSPLPSPGQPEDETETFIISMVGDCTLATVPGYEGSPYAYEVIVGDNYAYPFEKTAQYFQNDDFTFANLESCLTTSTNAAAKTFVFKTDPSYANILKEGGVDFVTLANNHILDYGEQGVTDTQAALDGVGVAYAGRDEYAIYETDRGLKIGVYAVSFGSTVQIEAGIAALKELGAEFIIAALHWGDEGSYTPNSIQISQGHAAIDAGADIVYGSHPHTLQPVEEYNGHYIYYSMGNWTFGGNTNPRDKDTFILQLTLEKDADGNVTVTECTHIPCASSGEESYNNYQPVPYEPDSEGYLRVLSKLDGSFDGADLSVGYSYSSNE